jgi:tetratricopeptide (TPR) repeat protein
MQPRVSSPVAFRLRLLIAAVLIGGFVLYMFAVFSQAQHENSFAHATLKDLQEAQAKSPNDEAIQFELAHRLERDNQIEDALKIMRQLARRRPDNLTYWQGLARCASDNGHAQEALDAYKKCYELSPTWATGHLKRAEILATAGLKTEALQEYDKGVTLETADQVNVDPWVECLIAKGRDQEAWDRLALTAKRTMLSDKSYRTLTDLGIRLNRTQEADSYLEGRIQSTPNYPTEQYRICQLSLILSSKPTPAILRDSEQIALDITRRKEALAPSFAMLAHIRLLRGNIPGAEQALADGLKLDPKSTECLELLAEAYRKAGKFVLAQQTTERLLKLKGETPEIAALRQSVLTNSQDDGARLLLAAALERAGKYGDAAEVYEEVLQRRPQEPTALAQRDVMRRKALEKLDQESKKIVAEIPKL